MCGSLRNFSKFGLKFFISRVEVRKVPIYVGGRRVSLAEKLSLLSFPLTPPPGCTYLGKSENLTKKHDDNGRLMNIINMAEY